MVRDRGESRDQWNQGTRENQGIKETGKIKRSVKRGNLCYHATAGDKASGVKGRDKGWSNAAVYSRGG